MINLSCFLFLHYFFIPVFLKFNRTALYRAWKEYRVELCWVLDSEWMFLFNQKFLHKLEDGTVTGDRIEVLRSSGRFHIWHSKVVYRSRHFNKNMDSVWKIFIHGTYQFTNLVSLAVLPWRRISGIENAELICMIVLEMVPVGRKL